MHPRNSRISQLLGAKAISGALMATLAQPAMAQTVAAAEPSTIDELVVTASRRAQDVTTIPYNITAVGSEAIRRAGVANIEDLSRQVPNLVVTSSGAQFLGAQRQIMRGLNASSSDRNGVALEQNPVSTYLGNAPYGNFFQVKDIERVEVLRGPQGTLYGAGALGGAIRLIPTAPALGSVGGSFKASAADVQHSSDTDYGVEGVLNLPIGETLALRLGASQDYTGGFINQYGAWLRAGNSPLGDPTLINANAPLTSAAQSQTLKDVNSSKAVNLRAALRWKPTEEFEVTAAFNRSRLSGSGPSYDTPAYNGGVDPLNPNVTYPDTGKYEVVLRGLSPFNRTTEMSTLDASYDLGFATVSSTTSYFETEGETYVDGTWGVLALPAGYLPYYTGSPANPRFNAIQSFEDTNKVFTQEVRLVSNGDGPLDYVLGAFFQTEKNETVWNGFAPGQTAYNQLPGVTVPGFNPQGDEERIWLNGGYNKFKDKSVFGELTWHVNEKIDITAGARVFKQNFRRYAASLNPVFGLVEVANNTTSFSDAKFRFNATYEYVDDHRAYFTFSQGFRRGGANSFTLTGFLREPSVLLAYQPDAVDNFEVGLKGRFSNGWRYTADAFLGVWKDPQIGGFTAVNFWPVVFNGDEAESKGFEFELSGRLTDEFSFSGGYSYTDAKLTKDFCLPSGDGSGRPGAAGELACAIQGSKGDPLPSAPKHSGTFTLNYEHPIGADDALVGTLSANYKGKTRQNLPTRGQLYPQLPSYWLVNAYAGWEHGPVTTAIFMRNVFDERVVTGVNSRITAFKPIDGYESIGRPRVTGVEISYRW